MKCDFSLLCLLIPAGDKARTRRGMQPRGKRGEGAKEDFILSKLAETVSSESGLLPSLPPSANMLILKS